MIRRFRGDDDPIHGPADADYERSAPYVPEVTWEEREYGALFGPDGAVAVWVDLDARPVVGFAAGGSR